MSKHAISNEKESVGAIIKKFMHVIGINHRLCKWILPCNLGKNIIMAGEQAVISCTGSEGTYHEYGLPTFGDHFCNDDPVPYFG